MFLFLLGYISYVMAWHLCVAVRSWKGIIGCVAVTCSQLEKKKEAHGLVQQHATYINLRALGARTLLSENVAEWQFTSYTACNVFEITNSLKSLNLIVFFVQGATLRTRLNTRSKWCSLTFSMAQRLTKKCTEGWLFILQILSFSHKWMLVFLKLVKTRGKLALS